MRRFHMVATMRVDADDYETAQRIVRARLEAGFGDSEDPSAAQDTVTSVHVTGTPITTPETGGDDVAAA